MTLSQWLDILVVAIAFVAAVSGWRSGAVGSLLSFVGVVLGAVAGVLLAPHIVNHIEGARLQLFATLFLILALVVDRRDFWRCVGPGGAWFDPQQRHAWHRLDHRGGAAASGGRHRGVDADANRGVL